MSGGQTSYFAGEREQKDFLCSLMQDEKIEVYYWRRISDITDGIAVDCAQLTAKPLSAFSLFEGYGDTVIFFLWNPELLGTVASVRAEGGAGVISDGRFMWAWAGAIEFRASLEIGNVLQMGRIAVMDKYFDAEMTFRDRPEVSRYYDRLKRKLSKLFVRTPCWGFMPDTPERKVHYRDIHVTPGALAWERSGGILKQGLDSRSQFTCLEG